LEIAKEIASLDDEKKRCQAERAALNAELERLKAWGEIDLDSLKELSQKGIKIAFYEMSKAEYDSLDERVKTVRLETTKASVKFMLVESDLEDSEDVLSSMSDYRLALPQISTNDIKRKISESTERIEAIDKKIASYAGCAASFKKAIKATEKEIEFEIYATGMESEVLSADKAQEISVAYFKGYIEAENLDGLKNVAAQNSWGLLVEEPTEEDDVPTKLKNNKFVSLIYPLTDFLGTVPGYFEYDISAWFLAFILIFFGIIFGDGGYGLLITAIAAIPIVRSIASKKEIPPTFLLVGLLGLSTVLWGMLTCTWFGLAADQLPQWLRSLSVPVISNVYADKLWTLPWCAEGVGLTTAQNLQIFCFSLALIQLTVAHIRVL